ncbi:FCD domain-containing protein [Pseudonocardia yunnanensis]|uniref:FadR/GntR family transcriptional regulator n=1 Tax=Pseudonocardia yunnanensis TaxID=58107 RepID=A0ABW4ENC5_9PSEU
MRLLSGDARQAVFAPLDDGSGRSEAVVRRLGSAIALGIIVDGEQLPSETQLAAMLNVSTVTLRDALSDLRARGLVSTRRGRGGGSFVRASEEALTELSLGRLHEIGSTDLRELGDVHAAVAGTAARLCAQRATASEIARLREILDRMAASPEGIQQRRIESRYYIDTAAAAQSVRLARKEIELQAELGQLLWGTPLSAPELASTVANHRQVVDAIEARDGALARRITEDHIGEVTAHLIDVHLRLTRRGQQRSARQGSHFPPAAAGAG